MTPRDTPVLAPARKRHAWLLLLGVLLLAAPFVVGADHLGRSSVQSPRGRSAVPKGAPVQGEVVHVVRPGETLSSISRLYGVSREDIAEANGLANPHYLYAGQRLTIPGLRTEGEVIHVVARGESLIGIARRYGVDPIRLAVLNDIGDVDLIRVGQRLRIPGTGIVTHAPVATLQPPASPEATPTPAASPPPPTTGPVATPGSETSLACLCEAIVISGPARDATVSSPVTVTGLASGFEQTAAVAILDGSGTRIGWVSATILGPYGQQGAFTVTLPFDIPANSQPGRIQVWSESPRDGAIEHLSSVTVMIQGLDLDSLLERLQMAIPAKDYETLRALMGDPFQVSLYESEEMSLSLDEAIQALSRNYLGPGLPRLDFSKDARKLLGDRVDLDPGIVHVVYSSGWGKDRNDDAFLLIGAVRGRARWIGMIYVKHELIDYRPPS